MGSLRTYYGKEVGKERGSKTSGAGAKQVYISKWPYFKALDFLRDNITPRKTVSNLEIAADDFEVVAVDVDQDQDQDQPGVMVATPEKSVFPVNNPPSEKNKKKRSVALEDELLSTCISEMKRPKNDLSDADNAFGHYISNQLKKIPNGYRKEMLKLDIQQVIIKVMLPRQPLSTISCEELSNILPLQE